MDADMPKKRHIVALSGGESSAAVAVLLKDINPIRLEAEFAARIGKDIHFLKGISLKRLREIEESQIHLFDDGAWTGECIGLCGNKEESDGR